jgi:hypothetical protein
MSGVERVADVPRIRARVRRWGSSLGIVVPRKVARELRLKEDDEVVLEINRSAVGEAFGSATDWVVDPQRLKDELRRGW